MTINQRADVDDVRCDVVCTGRFYDFLEKRNGRWGLVLRQPIYAYRDCSANPGKVRYASSRNWTDLWKLTSAPLAGRMRFPLLSGMESPDRALHNQPAYAAMHRVCRGG